MPANELMLWATLGLIVGGAATAWILKSEIWRGAAVVIGGLALSVVAAGLYGPFGSVANLVIYAIGGFVAGSAASFDPKRTVAVLIGSAIGAFAISFLVQLAAG